MQRLSLTDAKAIVATTKTLLPLVYKRDMTIIVQAHSTITAAFAMLRNLATDKEHKDALAAIKTMQAVLPASVKEAQAISVEARLELKKLAHPSTDGTIHLAPRRLRREAACVVAKEERRLERERQDRMAA